MSEAEKWKKRYEREKKARLEAESLLESKSRALYQKKMESDRLVLEQEALIENRTRELQQASDEVQLLSDAVSRTQNGVIISGPDNTVVWANEATTRITGYCLDELKGKVPGHVLQGKETDEATRTYMRQKIQARESFEAEVLNVSKKGREYWIHISATPVFDDSGRFKYFVAIQSDITRERATRERLEFEIERANLMAERAAEASTQKTKFLATMSHELRTPLNSVIGYTQILEQNNTLDEAAMSQLRVIRRSSGHLLSLINDVLDVAKIEAGSHKLSPSRFELEGLLKSVIEMLRSKAGEKGLKLNYQFIPSGDIPEHKRIKILADSRAVRQVLINLIGNSIKFTDQGAISLDVKMLEYADAEAKLQFAVTDTGRGIPKDKIKNLFEPFTQVDEGRDLVQGSGLGLSIAYHLVQQMGGQLEVQSSLTYGSCFSFVISLPVDWSEETMDAELLADQNSQARFPIGYAGRKRSVLIVDDVAENQDLLFDLLLPLGFEIELAGNGREALDRIRAKTYDLVLSDVIMPFMNGYELVEHLRADKALAGTCIIAISASLMQLTPQEKNQMKRFDGFVAKPVEVDELFGTMQQLLQLEWIFPATDAAEQAADTGGAGVAALPAGQNLLDQLYWWGRIGDIKQLRQAMPRLEKDEPELFAEVNALVKSDKPQQVAELIGKSTGGVSNV